eukprot:m.61873 g.61873  ORF g.61873 m.61873 type:complete len:629 (-) comp23049_c1_seq2:331-2217(-)
MATQKLGPASLLGFPSDVPTTDYRDIVLAMDSFAVGFETVATNLHKGSESAKLAHQFVDRWQKIETSYTKQIDELLESNIAQLVNPKTMFGGNDQECVEPVSELRGAWSAFTDEILKLNQDRKQVAEAVRNTICVKLAKFTERLGTREENLVTEARKVMAQARQSTVNLSAKSERFVDICKAAAEDVLLVSPAYEPMQKADIMSVLKTSTQKAIRASKISTLGAYDPETMTPPQRRRMATIMAELSSPSVQKVLDSLHVETVELQKAVTVAKAQSAVVYTDFMPKIMCTLHDIELQRISYMKHCIGHMATGMLSTGKKTRFEESRRRVDMIMPNVVKSCVISQPLPPPPIFEEPNWESLLESTIVSTEVDVSDITEGDFRGSSASLNSISSTASTGSAIQIVPKPVSTLKVSSSRKWFGRTKSPRASPVSTPEVKRRFLASTSSVITRGLLTPETHRKSSTSSTNSTMTESRNNSARNSVSVSDTDKEKEKEKDIKNVKRDAIKKSTTTTPKKGKEVVKFPGTPPIFSRHRQLSTPYFEALQPSYRNNSPKNSPQLQRRTNGSLGRSRSEQAIPLGTSTSTSILSTTSTAPTPTRRVSHIEEEEEAVISPSIRNRSRSFTSPKLDDLS